MQFKEREIQKGKQSVMLQKVFSMTGVILRQIFKKKSDYDNYLHDLILLLVNFSIWCLVGILHHTNVSFTVNI